MDLGLRGKTAIVCASSKGLGKAVALGLAEEGVNLTICARGKEALEKTANEIRDRFGVNVLSVQADVSNPEDVKKVVSLTVSTYSTVHILVNNAGGPPVGSFLEIPPHEWQRAVELNLFSTVNFTREVLPYMRKQKWGRIINITSIAVKQPLDGLILSNTARAGVIGFAKTVSNEFARENILVNNVCPGRILTDRIIELASERARRYNKSLDEVIRAMEEDIPAGRIGTPEELANLVVFLASERASYITGTTIQVDGGLVKAVF